MPKSMARDREDTSFRKPGAYVCLHGGALPGVAGQWYCVNFYVPMMIKTITLEGGRQSSYP